MKRKLAIIAVVSVQLAVIAACIVWYLAPWAASCAQPIEVTGGPSGRFYEPDGLHEYYSVDEMARHSDRDGVQLGRPVDFAREKLVRVNWTDTGPLHAQLAARARWGGQRIDFFIDETPANHATFSKMAYEDWYVVPRAAEVRFAGRDLYSPGGFYLMVLSAVSLCGIAIGAKRRWRR
jgi:hypothetical protein